LSRASLALRETWQPICDALGAVDLEHPAPELPRLCEQAFRDAQVDTASARYFGVPHGHPSEAAIEERDSAPHPCSLATPRPFAVAASAAVRARQRFYGDDRDAGIVTGGAGGVLERVVAALRPQGVYVPRGPPRCEAAVSASIDAHPRS
jgi:hypothetical protein